MIKLNLIGKPEDLSVAMMAAFNVMSSVPDQGIDEAITTESNGLTMVVTRNTDSYTSEVLYDRTS